MILVFKKSIVFKPYAFLVVIDVILKEVGGILFRKIAAIY